MRRWLPYPPLSLALLAMWLLLQQSLAPGQLLLGAALALYAPLATAALLTRGGRMRRPTAIMRLARRVIIDVVRSNVAVALIILGRHRRHSSGFISIPLRLRDRHGLTVLACIITATPGTLWIDYDSSRGVVLIHVLDLIDEAAWVAIITQRYERLLLEIFE